MRPVRIGVAGLGMFGEVHIQAMSRIPEFELVSVCSRSEERARQIAETYGVSRWYTDLQSFAADPEIEAVDIVNEVGRHAEVAQVALEAGKDVLVEKPLSARMDESGLHQGGSVSEHGGSHCGPSGGDADPVCVVAASPGRTAGEHDRVYGLFFYQCLFGLGDQKPGVEVWGCETLQSDPAFFMGIILGEAVCTGLWIAVDYFTGTVSNMFFPYASICPSTCGGQAQGALC